MVGTWLSQYTLALAARGQTYPPILTAAPTVLLQPAAPVVSGNARLFDEQLGNGDWVCNRTRTNRMLTTTSVSEQQVLRDDNRWTNLPHHVLWNILERLRWERKACGAFRRVCERWREAHDERAPSLILKAPALPYQLLWRRGFAGVSELNLSSFRERLSPDGKLLAVLGSLSDLRSLNLANHKLDNPMIRRLTSAGPVLTRLTHLNLAGSDMHDFCFDSMACNLPSLTYLDFAELQTHHFEGWFIWAESGVLLAMLPHRLDPSQFEHFGCR